MHLARHPLALSNPPGLINLWGSPIRESGLWQALFDICELAANRRWTHILAIDPADGQAGRER
jgi:hypothetical protein